MNRSLCHHIMTTLLLAAIAAGCGGIGGNTVEAVYKADGIEVYTDSIIFDGREYNAVSATEITNAWKGEPAGGELTFTSGSRMADALFNKSMDELASAPGCSDTDVFLLLAFLAPEKSKETLRRMAADGVIHRPGFPPVDDREAWAAAAWEVYCATGDRKWLEEAYGIIKASLAATGYGGNNAGRLVTGIPEYMQPPRDYFPSWMRAVDLMQVKSLGANVWRYRTLEVAADMAGILGRKEETALRHRAATLRGAINDNFWEPSLSRYGEYLYGNMFPILSPAADNYAGALCALFGIATDEMAGANVESTVTLAAGIPLTYPSLKPEGIVTPRVQSLCGLVAAKVHDPTALRQAVGALWTLCLDDGDPTAWPTLLMRGILGIHFTPDGIEVNPFIPAIFSNSRSLKGLRYRDAVIDITVNGTGDRIASATLDGSPTMSAFIPADIKGKHTMTITLTGNTLHEREPLTAKDASMPPVPKVYWSTPREARILNHIPGTDYHIYVNGVMTETIGTDRYSVNGGGTQVIDIVPVHEGKIPVTGFSPGSHVCAPETDIISIPAYTITPRRSPLHLIKNKEIATRYIELAARHNTRLTFYVNAPSAGEYFLSIMYANGTTETAFRTVEANSRAVGTIACPPINHNDWITTGESTTITLPLVEGANKLSLYYAGTTILLNEIKLLKK